MSSIKNDIKLGNIKSKYTFESTELFENIKHILTSKMRTKILISLFSSKKDLKSLRKDINKPSTTILHGIKELENLRLVKKQEKKYFLSSNGYLWAVNMLKLIENLSSVDNNFHFWKNHLIDDIPHKFLKNIYLIKNAQCIYSDDGDLAKVSNSYMDLISESKNLKIIMPIFSTLHLNGILNSLVDGETLELIVTENILDSIKTKGYGEKLLSITDGTINKKDDGGKFNDSNNSSNIKVWKIPE